MAATAQAPVAPGALRQPRERWYARPLALPIFYGALLGHVLLALLAVLAIVAAPLVFNDQPFPDASTNPTTNPVQLYHLGLWFNNPQDAFNAGGPNTGDPL